MSSHEISNYALSASIMNLASITAAELSPSPQFAPSLEPQNEYDCITYKRNLISCLISHKRRYLHNHLGLGKSPGTPPSDEVSKSHLSSSLTEPPTPTAAQHADSQAALTESF
jgi:hypothetical protein